jgi:hypothetical protein
VYLVTPLELMEGKDEPESSMIKQQKDCFFFRRWLDIGKGGAMTDEQEYMVSAFEPEGTTGALVFTFVPRALQQERGPGGAPKRVPQFVVAVRPGPDGLDFDWSGSPDNPGAAGTGIQAEISTRIKERAVWIDRVNELVGLVERWAKELDWATRRVEKKLDDARVGKHRVPALLMQA